MANGIAILYMNGYDENDNHFHLKGVEFHEKTSHYWYASSCAKQTW